MRVYGIDFNCAPSARKPITCALCRLEDDRLYLDALCALESMECFHNLLASDGPWVAGMDFAFGLPRDFVLPMKSGDPERTVIEACPMLVAQALIGRRPYKDEASCAVNDPRAQARFDLLDALRADRLRQRYGLRISGLCAYVDEFAEDERGGAIDALMCAVQAAWAWTRRDAGFGIRTGTDLNDGWIADPATSSAITA